MPKVRRHGNGVSFEYSAEELHKLRLLLARYGTWDNVVKAGAIRRVNQVGSQPREPSLPWWKKLWRQIRD